MLTKGFLMFWGGISGLVITLLLAVLIIAVSIKKKKKTVEIFEDEQTENIVKKTIPDSISVKPVPDTGIKETEMLLENMKNMLHDTQLTEIKKGFHK